MDYTKLTIKHFISDLPRIFNSNLEVIKNLFNKFVVEENENTISLKTSSNVSLKGDFDFITASTARVSNLQILGSNNKYISLDEYIEEKVKEIIAAELSK